jgi:hypothetical protein
MPLSYDPDSDSLQYTGEQTGYYDHDWFSIETDTDGILVVHMADYDNAGNEQENITLYDGSLNQLDTAKIWYQDGSAFVSSKKTVKAGKYYVQVTANTFTHRYVFEPDMLN